VLLREFFLIQKWKDERAYVRKFDFPEVAGNGSSFAKANLMPKLLQKQ
jgi:hypothetical protein